MYLVYYENGIDTFDSIRRSWEDYATYSKLKGIPHRAIKKVETLKEAQELATTFVNSGYINVEIYKLYQVPKKNNVIFENV